MLTPAQQVEMQKQLDEFRASKQKQSPAPEDKGLLMQKQLEEFRASKQQPIQTQEQPKGLFQRYADGAKKALQFGADVLVNPVARELERPFVSMVRGIQGLIPGGKTGQGPMETPFGSVKPYSELSSKEAAMGALELATSVPAAGEKVVGTAIKPVFPLLKKGEKAAEAGLKGSAVKSFGQALRPTTQANKFMTKQIAEEAIQRGVVGTQKQILSKAAAGVEKAGTALDEFGTLKGSIKTDRVLSALEKEKEAFKVGGKIINQKAINTIDEVSDALKQFGDDIDAEHLRAIRKIWDKEVSLSKGFVGKTLKEGTEMDIKKMATSTIRGILAEDYPDLAKLNKEFTFWKRLQDVAEASAQTQVGQSGLIRKGLGFGLGFIKGGLGGAYLGKQLADLVGSSIFQTLSAQVKYKLADTLFNNPKQSIKLIDFLVKRGAFGAVKIKDVEDFLNQEKAPPIFPVQNQPR